MPVFLDFHCSGCDAIAISAGPLRSEFVSLSGQSHGLGCQVVAPPTSVVPEGWVGWDPFTGCCYCPDCWRAIEEDTADDN